jgi:diguanylate cyclase (GGDEF)-like protein/PAS domain S-box-containing protein
MGDDGGQTGGLVDPDDSISARDVLEAAPDALVIVDDEGVILQLNGPAEQLFGYSRGELVGRPVESLIPVRYRAAHVRQRTEYGRDLRRRPMGHGPELYGLRSDGTEFPVEISLSPLRTRRGMLVIAAVRDISARKRAEAERSHLIRERALYAEISRLARHDALTGLPNRSLLHDRLAAAIASGQRHGTRLAVLFLDLDRFKQVNDSLGHATGDQLLQAIATRLSESVRGTDTVCRQGGDEFVVLLSDVQRKEDVAAATSKVIAAVNGPHKVGRRHLHATASVGVALYPENGRDADTLLKNADIAMYYAKDHGRDHFRFFDEEMNARIVERQALETSLRSALAREEFHLRYQPKVSLATGRMTGAEALLRWEPPDRGVVMPETFIPVAEDCGLIVPIGRWVLGEACRQAREWQRSGLETVPIAVNISALEFRHDGFLDGVRAVLHASGLEPRLLELEVTETVLMESVAGTAAVLRALKAMGLSLAVDDFGTGYSSLSYLMQFPIDALKLDRSFVQEIGGGAGDSPVISAVIGLGTSLGQRVIAEGIETQEQLAFLQGQRCQEGQGFHFSQPLPGEEFATLLGHSA